MPGMDRTRAAGRQQRILRGNAAALGDGDARRARHVLVDHVVHAEGGAARLDAQRRREPAERAVGRRAIDLHGAAQEEVGVEVAQGEVGVGHGGFRAAAAVAGRSRLRAAALGPDIERAEVRLARDRAAARADLDQLDSGDLDRQSGAAQKTLFARGFEAVGDQRLAVVDQGELGGRAAHVEGEYAFQPGVAAEPGAGQRAGGRAAFQQLHRRALGLAHVGEAAVGQHEEEAARECLRRAAPVPGARDRSRPAAAHRRWSPSCWRAGIRGSRARCRTTARSRGSGSARRRRRRWRARAQDWRRRAGSRWRGSRRPASPDRRPRPARHRHRAGSRRCRPAPIAPWPRAATAAPPAAWASR